MSSAASAASAVQTGGASASHAGDVTPGQERRIKWTLIALVLVLANFVYAFGYDLSNPKYQFVGQAYNIVDFSVYLSWTRQAADGHFASLNLFTTDPQKGLLFNALFLSLGLIVRLTHLPIPIVFLLTRTIGGGILLWLIYRFYTLCLPDAPIARLAAFGLTALGSGFGWIAWPAWSDNNAGSYSVDVWQPEAFTFLSIYTSALFVVALIFIVGAFYFLLLGERTNQLKYGVYAGLCGLVLGNIHSYDVLHIAAGWGLYVIVMTALERRFDMGRWGRAFVAGLCTLPTTVYQFLVFQWEPVFHARALTPTLTSPIQYYAAGYGLVFILALAAIGLAVSSFGTRFEALFADRKTMIFAFCWAVAGLSVIYLPFKFQRKMVMGEHIPLCLLAGAAAAFLITRFVAPRARLLVSLFLVALTFPTNALFLVRDFNHLRENRSETSASPYLGDTDADILRWVRENTKPTDAILAFPPLSEFFPGYDDRAVWVGHWSETPNYGKRLSQMLHIFAVGVPDGSRIAFLRKTKTDYLVYPNDAPQMTIKTRYGLVPLEDFATHSPAYLQKVYRNKDYTVFRIMLPIE